MKNIGVIFYSTKGRQNDESLPEHYTICKNVPWQNNTLVYFTKSTTNDTFEADGEKN